MEGKLTGITCEKLLKILPEDCVDLLTERLSLKNTIYLVIPQNYEPLLGIYTHLDKAKKKVSEIAENGTSDLYGKIWILPYHVPFYSKNVYVYMMCETSMSGYTPYNFFVSTCRDEVENFINFHEYAFGEGMNKTNVDTCLKILKD